MGAGAESGFRSWTRGVVTVYDAIKSLRISSRLQLGFAEQVWDWGNFWGELALQNAGFGENWRAGRAWMDMGMRLAFYPSTAAAVLRRMNLACRHCSHDAHATYPN